MKELVDEIIADAIKEGFVTTRCRSGPTRVSGSKLLDQCTLPLTGAGCIQRVVTDLAYLEIHNGAFHLIERAPGVSVDEIIAKTAGKLMVMAPVPEMKL